MENTKNNRKIHIDNIMYIYITYICYIIINDYVTYIYGKESNLITYGISFLLIIILIICFKNRIIVDKSKLEKIDIIIIIAIILLFVLRLCISENSFDTLNYHIILQENPFKDYIDSDFFSGRNINTFSYPLGDRMFFPFRSLLGYRLGVILNLVVIILIYYKVKQILNEIIYKIFKFSLKPIVIGMIAFISIYSEKIYSILCIYYIDILYIPLFLELIRLMIVCKKDEYNINDNVYIGILSGIIVSMKITNVLFVGCLYIIYFFETYKKLKIKDYICLICIPIIPILIYLLNIYIQTGNPVFPYYNSIFKSRYFSETNWEDTRFGPKSLLETLIWPIAIFFQPNRTDDVSIYSGRLSLAYTISIIFVIYYLAMYKKSSKRLSKEFRFIGIFILLNLIWSKFMIGYIRYALVLEILSSCIISVCAIYTYFIILNKKNRILIFTSIGMLMTINIMLVSKYIFLSNTEWAWRNPFYKDITLHIDNAKYLFKDRVSGIEQSKLEKIECWGIVDYNSGYAKLLKKDIPIVSLNASVSNELTNQKLNNIIRKYDDGMYTIAENDRITEVISQLDKQGFTIDNTIIKVKPNFISSNKSLYLMKIKKKLSQDIKNECIIINDEKNEYSIDISNMSSLKSFSCIAGLDPIAENWNSDGFNLDFYVVNNDGNREKIYTKSINPGDGLEKIDFGIDLNKYNKASRLLITLSNDETKNGDSDWAIIINPDIN